MSFFLAWSKTFNGNLLYNDEQMQKIAAKVGLSEQEWQGGGMGMAHHILADQLTLSEPGRADYAHHSNNGTHRFSDLPTALQRSKVSTFLWALKRQKTPLIDIQGVS